MKVTRRHLTPKDRLAELDEQIAKAESRLEALRAKRLALVAETKQRAADLLSQVTE